MIKSCSFTLFVSFFHKKNAPEGGVLARFYRPGGGGFELLFCPEVGISPIEKSALGFCLGGVVRLGID